ncbi:MAG TPA: hypothetical protein PKK26_04430, partial [Candidatus Wallbacteria bacterium]|nr:hypothetical protein [Candidatus Wallbacteria bacterium]
MTNKRFNSKSLVSLLGIIFMLSLLIGCGGGGGGGGGSIIPADTTTPATISGNIASSASAAPGVAFQATNKEYTVKLVDADGVQVPDTDLDPADPAKPADPKNNFKVKDGQAYTFKVKNFIKPYKVVAQGDANEILSVFIGKVKTGDNITERNADPRTTAYALIYGDNKKDVDAGVFKSEEAARKNSTSFVKKLDEVAADIKTKQQTILNTRTLTDPAQLENAYKDAVLGTAKVSELKKLIEGLEIIFKNNAEFSANAPLVEKLKEILALVASDGKRQNETSVKDAKDKLKTVLAGEAADAKKDTDNKDAYKDAKIAYSLVSSNLGDIYKNKVSSPTATAANAPSLMAAYQAIQASTLDASAKKEYDEGFKAVENLEADANDKIAGRDKHIAAALLKNASELAKEDPNKLDIAKKKADTIVAKLESEGKAEFELPTGETINKDKALEKKGEALINAGRSDEAVQVFQDVTEPKIKNFGLGRAYLQLNDLENAYNNLKDAVKEVINASNTANGGSDARRGLEEKFNKINEALFAFAAIIDKIQNDLNFATLKNTIQSQEKNDKVLETADAGKIIGSIKPTTNLYQVGKTFVDQKKLGQNIVDIKTEADPLLLKFENARKLILKANDFLEKAKSTAVPEILIGSVDTPQADTVLKYLNDAKVMFEELSANATLAVQLRGQARYNVAVIYLNRYRALQLIKIQDSSLLAEAKKLLYDIQASINEDSYTGLEFSVDELIRNIEKIETESEGIVGTINALFAEAEKIRKRADSLREDKQNDEAIAEYNKSFSQYDQAFKSNDASINAKMREAALYFSGHCKFYVYMLMTVKDETVKNAAIERFKLFLLKFPNSDFSYSVQDMLNNINNLLSDKINPGVEFDKAKSLMDKLRFLYKNNATTTEIEAAFPVVEKILRAIAVDNATDAKYLGAVTGTDNMNNFRANAKFMLAILYMERYVIPRMKEIKYKNLAIQIYNELLFQNSEQPFIPDVKRFIAQLQNDGKPVEEFQEGRPIITDVMVNPPMIELDKAVAAITITVSANAMVPDTLEGDLKVVKVIGEVKQFGNAVFISGDATKPLVIELTRDAVKKSKWNGSFSINQPAPGSYDFIITASTADGKKAVMVNNYVVKPKAAFASIEKIEALAGQGTTIFKVFANVIPQASFNAAPGNYTDAYVTLMQPEVTNVAAAVDAKFMQSLDFARPIKLDRDSADPKAFILDLAKAFPELKEGNYIFLFKLVNLNPADPDMSLNAPVNVKPFNFMIKREIDGAVKDIVLPLYNKILAILGDSSRTAEDRIAEYEKMYADVMSAEHRALLVKALRVLGTTGKIKLFNAATPEFEIISSDMIKVRAPWQIEGTYIEDLPSGIVTPDGTPILPPGKKGFILRSFVIDDAHKFVKRFVGVEAWLLSEGGSTTGAMGAVTKPQVMISEIAGKAVPPAAITPVDIQISADVPFILVKGTGFKPLMPEHKRVLQLSGPAFQFPMVLADSGSFNWSDNDIRFDSGKLKGLKDVYMVELFDSQFGLLASVPIRFATTTAAFNANVYIFELQNGEKIAPAFGLSRPFEVDKTKDLIIKGDKMMPAAGVKYALVCYSSPVTTTSGTTTATSNVQPIKIELLTSDDTANWTLNKITLKADVMKAKALIPNVGSALTIVQVGGIQQSSMFQVVFFDQAFDANNQKPAIITSVNGYDAQSVVNLDRPAGVSSIDLSVVGQNFSAPSRRHLDLVFQLPLGAVNIPLVDSFDTVNWTDTFLKAKLDFTRQVPVIIAGQVAGNIGDYFTQYPAGLIIVDDMLGKPVTPTMVPIKFVAGTQNMPVITKVNGLEFFGTPIPIEVPLNVTLANLDLKFEGQNFGTASPTRVLFMKPQPSPTNPVPASIQLMSPNWSNNFIGATTPLTSTLYGVSNIAIFEAVTTPVAGTAVTSTTLGPLGWKQISKDIMIEVKKPGATTTIDAKITKIRVFSSSNAIPQEFDPAQTVKVPFDAVGIQLIGEKLKALNGNFRILFMRMKGTVEQKYVNDSNSANWTDTMIDLKIDPADKRFGLFEMFIVDPILGNKIISNIVNLDVQQSQTGAVINMINGIPVQPGIALMLKPDFTELVINGNNFGANADGKLKVMFEPMADPNNQAPKPVQLPNTSWTATDIKVTKPADTTIKLTRGFIGIIDSTTGMKACPTVQVSFGDAGNAANIPMVNGLMYDTARKVLKWDPIVSATTTQVYQFIITVDGTTFTVPTMVYEFPVTNLIDGPHTTQVQAQIPGSYPPVVGPLSAPVTFTTAGGAQTNNIPAVTGIFYDPNMKTVRWQPVQPITTTTTGTATGGTVITDTTAIVQPAYMKPFAYMIRLDGTMLQNPVYNTEFFVGNLPGGDHKIEIQAMVPDTYPPQVGPFSAPYPFNIGGATNTVPAPAGLIYDAATKSLKWNPVTLPATTAAGTAVSAAAAAMYMLRVDGTVYGPLSMTQFTLPAAFPGGAHFADVAAQVPGTYPPQVGPYSAQINFTLDGGTASTLPAVQGFLYDAATKKLKWQAVVPPAATAGTPAPVYVYMIMIDGMKIGAPVSGTEYPVDYLINGTHKAQIQVQVPGSNPLQAGPWSPATSPLIFEVGTTGGLAVPIPAGLAYDITAKKIKWQAVVPPAGVTPAPIYVYNVMIDGIVQATPVEVPEFTLLTVPAGMHVAQVQALVKDSVPAAISIWSTPLNFSAEGTGTTAVPAVGGLVFDATAKKLKWNAVPPPTVAPGTTAAIAYLYMLMIDSTMYGPFNMTEFQVPATLVGSHNAQVRAQFPSSDPMAPMVF